MNIIIKNKLFTELMKYHNYNKYLIRVCNIIFNNCYENLFCTCCGNYYDTICKNIICYCGGFDNQYDTNETRNKVPRIYGYKSNKYNSNKYEKYQHINFNNICEYNKQLLCY